jgi:predicted NBD/HSP70 family sugar kinase
VAVSADGQFLAAAFADGSIRVLDIETRKLPALQPGTGTAMARVCLFDGLSSGDADLAFIGSGLLVSLDHASLDILVATQLGWGLGVQVNADLAEKWLQRAAGQRGRGIPGVVQDWTIASWQAIQG